MPFDQLQAFYNAAVMEVPNLKSVASNLRGKSSLTQQDIAGIADCLSRTETTLAQVKQVLMSLDVPTWLPFVRIGYPEENPPFIADDAGVRIRGNALISGTVEASAFNISQPFVAGLTLTNSSPTATAVTWSACTITYQGTEYNISGGNTTDRFIWWVAGASTFSSGASFTPSTAVFLILTNTSGTGDTAWNKLAYGGVQRSNFMGPFLEGFKLEAWDELTVDTSVSGLVDLINITGEAGVLLSLSVYAKDTLGGTPAITLVMADVDGEVPGFQLVVYGNATTFDYHVHMAKQQGSGDGSTAGDYFTVALNLSYLNSVRVRVNRGGGTGTGEIYIAALRATRIDQ